MNELRNLVRQIIKEARTKLPGDLPQSEILDLVNHVLDGGELFDFSEKFAGSHAEILHRSETGEFSSKSKAGRAAGSGWGDPRGKAKQITDQMSSLETPGSSRRFGFEFIDSVQRPDYINYLIGDVPAAIEYTGELTKLEADSLNSQQNSVKFVSLEDISYDSFDLSQNGIISLEKARDLLSSGKLKRSELKSIGLEVSNIIASSIPQSLLGGPIEGLVATSGSSSFKIPNPDYANVQRIQSPLYAMFSGRGGVSKREIKSRLINSNSEDRLIKDMIKYLEAVPGLPTGFRTFFSEDEAEDLLDLIDSAVSGNSADGEKLYSHFNKRINDQASWINI